MIGMPPYYGVYDPTNLGGYTNVNRTTDLTDVYNPIPMSALSHSKSTGITYQTNLYAEVEPIKGLTYRIQAGVNGGYNQNKTWNDEYINGGTQYNINGIYEGSSHFVLGQQLGNAISQSTVHLMLFCGYNTSRFSG